MVDCRRRSYITLNSVSTLLNLVELLLRTARDEYVSPFLEDVVCSAVLINGVSREAGIKKGIGAL
jgi:hypothetical protein